MIFLNFFQFCVLLLDSLFKSDYLAVAYFSYLAQVAASFRALFLTMGFVNFGFNVLLQVLDDGRMTDGKGRTVSFKNTILIMTSNLGSHIIMELGQSDPTAMRNKVEELLHQQFRPEFLNRVDEIITFHGLSREDLLKIVAIQIRRMADRLEEHKFKVELTTEAKLFLVETGFDPTFGARPLKRAIQRYIENPLALEILEGHFSEGDCILIDKGEDNRLHFKQK